MMPFAPEAGPVAARLDEIADPLCGIVTSLDAAERPDGAPEGFVCTVASVANTRTYGGWYADRIAAGTAFDDPDRAKFAALGEALERYCGNLLPADLHLATESHLRLQGHRVLGSRDLPRWCREQLRRDRFPYREISPGLELEWVSGVDSLGRAVRAPASWVYLNYHHGRRREFPRINHLNYAGIATGWSPADAARRALAELVERDAMVTWWASGASATRIDVASVPAIAHRWAGCPLELALVLIPTDLPLPVIGAYIFDPRTGVPAAGFSAGEIPGVAASKAVEEALQVWISSSGLLEESGPSWRAVSEGIFSAHVYFPYRADRRYLDDSGEDFSRVRDLACQTQLWLDPRMLAHADRFTGCQRSISVDHVPPGSIDAVLRELELRGHPPVAFDLTTADVAEVGAATVRVLAPPLVPNAPAAFLYLGSDRLMTRVNDLRPGANLSDLLLAPPPHN